MPITEQSLSTQSASPETAVFLTGIYGKTLLKDTFNYKDWSN